MHGGVKVYRGSAAAARNYVEADRSRADDYYLAEGTGLAERCLAGPDGVRPGGTLTGDGYEAWVAGCDPVSGAAKGRLRADDQAVRFVEVVVNGPKSWSLAAALDPEIAVAYDAAQDGAAEQIIGWLAQHATTRVGPRGRQVQVPVEAIEAVTVRHYTSRAGDPHRHLHLQVNARVFAEDKWRGLHTVGVRDSLEAINGIGHAAVATDPGFRAALAARGFTLDAESGEILELASYVGPFSARAAQICRNSDRYEAAWRTTYPGVEPGPALRRSWDARAWAEARPDKVIPRDGAELAQRWVGELYGLGYRDPHPGLVAPGPVPRIGELDREAAVGTVLTRLGARRSGWNAADVRGEVEQLIARTGIIADAAVRSELAEDLTARTLEACVPLLGRRGVPEHIRAWTSEQVLDVEADLVTRLVARADTPRADTERAQSPARSGPAPAEGGVPAARSLDVVQRAVVAALAGDQSLVVVEGAAGSGKTTTLTAAREALGPGRRLVVVTPTLKAAGVAARQIGASAYSAAWLAHQHGHRWDAHGAWTRLRIGDVDPLTGATYDGPSPAAGLSGGDVLLVDEAGMLDQDTARALFTVADEAGARVALVGDRHQLPAVGRGGILDLAARWAHPDACLTLDIVQRFADPDYAELSLAMRTGERPGDVFDALLARGEIQIHPSEAERAEALAETVATTASASAAGTASVEPGRALVVADTREQVTATNAAIRDRLVAAGVVDDRHTVTTLAGERLGVGDRVATRRNDRDLDVANREAWTVTGINADGALTVSGQRGQRALPAGYVGEQVELAYASTVYGAQGETVNTAHLLVGEHTGAAAAYVGMTRGRTANTAHLVAQTTEEARTQWVEAFGRDRADLGPAHAARLAALEADRYAAGRDLDRVLVDLHRAWGTEQDVREVLTSLVDRHETLTAVHALREANNEQLAPYNETLAQTRREVDRARARVGEAESVVEVEADQLTRTLRQRWAAEYPVACRAADTIHNGPGRLGQRRGQVRRAHEHLQEWADTWRPILPDLPTDRDALADAVTNPLVTGGRQQVQRSLPDYARRVADQAHPDLATLRVAEQAAADREERVTAARRQAALACSDRLRVYGHLGYVRDPAAVLADTDQQISQMAAALRQARARVGALQAEPAIRTLPPGRLDIERDTWQHDRDHARQARQPRWQPEQAGLSARRGPRRGPPRDARGQEHQPSTPHSDGPGRGMSR